MSLKQIRKNREKHWFRSYMFVVVIVAVLIGGLWYKNEQKLALYLSHSWTETEARFKDSSEHTQNDTIYYKGSYRETGRIYYLWRYSYEVDGVKYYCRDNSEQEERKPESGHNTRMVLVADDDPSLCLVYSDEDDLFSDIKFLTRTMPIGAAAVLLIWLGLHIITVKLGAKIDEAIMERRNKKAGEAFCGQSHPQG